MTRAAALLLALTLVATGCTSGSDGSIAEPTRSPTQAVPAPVLADPPTPFRAATTADGDPVTQCSDLRRHKLSSGLAARLVVPAGFSATSRSGPSCGFSGTGFGAEFYVAFNRGQTLKSTKEREVDPFEDEGGDDSVSDISYAANVPVYGRHRGERLAYYCYCDGQELDYRIVLANGVRLTWVTPHGRSAKYAAAYDSVVASMALVRSDLSTCRSRGRTVYFRPPVPQTESIEFYGPRCHLYLRPGRASLDRYAEIELHPPITLAERAERLGQRRHVVSVRYRPGSDRLTWGVARDKPGPYHSPTGRWRGVTVATEDGWVTWTARPSRWRTESDDARRFVDSVHR